MDKYLVALWILFIVLDALGHHNRISAGIYPKHGLAFAYRTVLAIAFVYFTDFTWYWSLLFCATTFQVGFKSLLNKLRGKAMWYVGRNSKIDLFQLEGITFTIKGKTIKIPTFPPFVWWSFELLLMAFAIGNLYFHGYCTWEEINAGYCVR